MSIFHKYKYFSSFEAGNCVSNSSFKWTKNKRKQFGSTRVNVHVGCGEGIQCVAFSLMKLSLVVLSSAIIRCWPIVGTVLGRLARGWARLGTMLCFPTAWACLWIQSAWHRGPLTWLTPSQIQTLWSGFVQCWPRYVTPLLLYLTYVSTDGNSNSTSAVNSIL